MSGKKLFLLLVLLVIAAGCGTRSIGPNTPGPNVLNYLDNDSQGAHGLLWRVESENAVVYLLGTTPVANDSIYPFSEQLNEIIRGSDALILEANLGDTAQRVYFETAMMFEASVLYTGEGGLSDYISEELFAQIFEIFTASEAGRESYMPIGIAQQVLDLCRPWALADELMTRTLRKKGIIPPIPKDIEEAEAAIPNNFNEIIFTMATDAGIPIGEIEGMAFRADLFNSMDMELQIRHLQEAAELYLGETDFAQAEAEKINTRIRAWRRRDANAFKAATDFSNPRTAFLLEERTPRMYDFALELINNYEGQFVIAVDAVYILSEIGIIERFLQDGFDVQVVAR
jgi:uncharacterized protein YbaP (TraB family)